MNMIEYVYIYILTVSYIRFLGKQRVASWILLVPKTQSAHWMRAEKRAYDHLGGRQGQG